MTYMARKRLCDCGCGREAQLLIPAPLDLAFSFAPSCMKKYGAGIDYVLGLIAEQRRKDRYNATEQE
jgi:hypothetical protein